MLKVPGQGKRPKKSKKPVHPALRTPVSVSTKMRFEKRDPVTGRTRVFYAHPKGASKRSDEVEAPHLIGASWTDYQSTVTGEMITGRRQHREHLEKHDLVEVGTENVQAHQARIDQEKIKAQKDERLKTILDTYDQLDQGREAAELENTAVTDLPGDGEMKHYTADETDFVSEAAN